MFDWLTGIHRVEPWTLSIVDDPVRALDVMGTSLTDGRLDMAVPARGLDLLIARIGRWGHESPLGIGVSLLLPSLLVVANALAGVRGVALLSCLGLVAALSGLLASLVTGAYLRCERLRVGSAAYTRDTKWWFTTAKLDGLTNSVNKLGEWQRKVQQESRKE